MREYHITLTVNPFSDCNKPVCIKRATLIGRRSCRWLVHSDERPRCHLMWTADIYFGGEGQKDAIEECVCRHKEPAILSLHS